MNKTIKSDLYRHEGLTGLRGFIRGWFIPGFRYTYVLRKVSEHSKYSPAGIFFRLLKRRYRYKYGFEISPEARIGDGFYLTGHCGPIIIGPVTIGKNCNISHSVTIGRSYRNGILGRPTLGDYVWIGPGAVLVGKITIGSDVMIAPNSFVNFDVPDHSLVIGNPGEIIPGENPTRNYINDIIDQ